VTAWLRYVVHGGAETPEVVLGELVVDDLIDCIRGIARVLGRKG
jgi:hypothetical protein